MSENTKIEHKGIVTNITENAVFVKIESIKACSACRAKDICGVDTSQKLIEVNNFTPNYQEGDKVKIIMAEYLGFKALFYGYVAPFLVLFIILITLIIIGLNEGLAALFALSSLPIYYYMLYLNKAKLKKEFTFNIEKLNF